MFTDLLHCLGVTVVHNLEKQKSFCYTLFIFISSISKYHSHCTMNSFRILSELFLFSQLKSCPSLIPINIAVLSFFSSLGIHNNVKQNPVLTSPWLLNPRISWLIQEVLPVWISCKWRNKFSLARPLPLSCSPWVRTPSNVDLPASTFPSTASFRSMNWKWKI